MLVIHVVSSQDTKDFSDIYDGLNAIVLVNPSKSECKQAITNEPGKIILIGHGTEYGLLNERLNGYLIDSKMVHLLRDKEIIGIWCNASNFAIKYDLKGFFTSMFISNERELIECGFQTFEDCEKEIEKQNRRFSSRVNILLLLDKPVSEWSEYLTNSLDNDERDFVYYNYEAFYATL